MKSIFVLMWQICYTVTKCHCHTCLINCSCLLNWMTKSLNSWWHWPWPELLCVMNQYVAQCNYYIDPYFNEHIINKVPATKSLFSLCHVNIRSIRKNLSEFEIYLQLLDHEFTIICLTETWLNDSFCEIYDINDLEHFDEDIESVYIEIGKDQLHS